MRRNVWAARAGAMALAAGVMAGGGCEERKTSEYADEPVVPMVSKPAVPVADAPPADPRSAGTEAPEPEPPIDPSAPRIDVAFCIDATGSMGGVIDRARAKIEEIASWLGRGTPRPYVRYGLVVFRDKGDEERLKSYGFMTSARAMRAALAKVTATGGGDLPEDVVGGLRAAVDLPWDPAAAVRVLFLVGDAEPHLDYGAETDDAPVLAAAKAKGIKIGTLACGGMTTAGHAYWKKVAAATGGTYQSLPGTSGTPAMAEMELEEAVFEGLRAEAARVGVTYPGGPGGTGAPSPP